MTLTEFLLARIAEDEASAREAIAHENAIRDVRPDWEYLYTWALMYNASGGGVGHSFQPGAPTPGRVVAECEAKRRIVQEHTPVDEEPGNWCNDCSSDVWPCPTMAALASIYADHPDYREEWRP